MREATAPGDVERTSAPADGARVSRLALFVSIACMFALCAAFFWIELTSPSDGTRIDPSASAWRANGVLVAPLAPQPADGLRAGDLVVAINGRSLESWSSTLFQPGAPALRTAFGQRLIYTVVRNHHRLNISVRLGAYPLGVVLGKSWGMLIFVVAQALVGLFVYARRPSELVAAVLLFGASCLLASSAWLFGLQVIHLTGGSEFWLYSVTVLGIYILFWTSQPHFGLAFPHPSALIRTRRWLAPSLYALAFAVYAVFLGVTRALAPATLSWLGLWEPGEVTIGVVCVALAVAVVMHTYRASSADLATQRKIRWVVLACVISGGGTVVLWGIPWVVFGHPAISTNILGLLLLPFPAALAIAILRYRLFDIDVIINRALVYGTLTATLAIVYFVCVLALEALIGLVARQTSTPAIVGSTLLSVALFQPLRRRIQLFIDRRFSRSKYDAARTLEAFATSLYAELDLTQLSQRLVAVVQETLEPTHVSLWLRAREAPADRPNVQIWERAARIVAPPAEPAGPERQAEDATSPPPAEAEGATQRAPAATYLWASSTASSSVSSSVSSRKGVRA